MTQANHAACPDNHLSGCQRFEGLGEARRRICRRQRFGRSQTETAGAGESTAPRRERRGESASPDAGRRDCNRRVPACRAVLSRRSAWADAEARVEGACAMTVRKYSLSICR